MIFKWFLVGQDVASLYTKNSFKADSPSFSLFILFYFIFLSFCLFRAIPTAYGGSHARGLISCSLRPTPQPHQCRIQAASATYTTAHVNAGSLTHWVWPGIEPETKPSWIHFHCTMMGTPFLVFLKQNFKKIQDGVQKSPCYMFEHFNSVSSILQGT